MSDTLRTFIAFKLPETIISHLHKIQKGLKSFGFRVGWVAPENIHLTLKFLGEIPKSEIENVSQAMAETAKQYPPMSFTAKGLGVFPTIKRPRVLWCGLKGDTYSLIQLQKTLEENLDIIGFPKEDRGFKAHLTLGRAKGEIDPKQLLEAIDKFSGLESENFAADRLILFRSELKPGGAVYTELNSIVLDNQVTELT
ncbi:MAG: 2'-5' RNA ligase [Desulfobacteraceae bacterium IS3]|nr:MAG: 2'-5' RNA ligase [Desulfobacteraceae bacterium IS3]HAO22504.1 RNA 2',3'-cyclic phosphodiesterase [Desulfobacteraceae bacterium]